MLEIIGSVCVCVCGGGGAAKFACIEQQCCISNKLKDES